MSHPLKKNILKLKKILLESSWIAGRADMFEDIVETLRSRWYDFTNCPDNEKHSVGTDTVGALGGGNSSEGFSGT